MVCIVSQKDNQAFFTVLSFVPASAVWGVVLGH